MGTAGTITGPTESIMFSSRLAGALPAVLVGLIFVQLLLFGSNRTDLALVAATVDLLLFVIVVASLPPVWLAPFPGWLLVGSFLIVLAVGVAQLVPAPAGLADPAWTYVKGAPGLITLDAFGARVEIVKLLALGALFSIAATVGLDDARAGRLFKYLTGAALAYSVVCFASFVLEKDTFLGVARGLVTPGRLQASFGSANTAGTLFGSFLVLSICDLTRRLQQGGALQHRLAGATPAILLLGLSATCALLSGSRAGLVAAAIAGVLVGAALLYIHSKRSQLSMGVLATALAVVGVLGAIFLVSGRFVLDRLAVSPGAGNTGSRDAIFAAHWKAFLQAPWFGHGLGSFQQFNPTVAGPSDAVLLSHLGATHNVYLQWLTEAGVVGTAAMSICVLTIVARSVLGLVRRRRGRTWLVGVLGVLLVFALHGAADYALQVPAMAAYLAVLLGLGYGLSFSSAERQKIQPTQEFGTNSEPQVFTN